jgi:hypothetical protein
MSDNGSFIGRLCKTRIQSQIPLFEFWLRFLPPVKAILDFFIRDMESEASIGYINGDGIAVLNNGKGTALGSFG